MCLVWLPEAEGQHRPPTVRANRACRITGAGSSPPFELHQNTERYKGRHKGMDAALTANCSHIVASA